MSALWIQVVDASFRPVKSARVRVTGAQQRGKDARSNEHRWEVETAPGETVTIQASAEGFESETHVVRVRDAVTQTVIGLRQAGQISYTYGNDRLAFSPLDNAFLFHIVGPGAADQLARVAPAYQLEWRPVARGAEAGDDQFVRIDVDADRANALSAELDRGKLTTTTYRVIDHGDRPARGLSNELVVRFQDDVTRPEADRLAGSVGMRIAREVKHAGNGFLLTDGGPASYETLKKADALAASGRVVYVEPNLAFVAQADQYTPNDPLFTQVPHLQLIDADEGWDLLDNVAVNLRGGSPNITIGVIDTQGVAPNHPDLTANLTDATGKLVSSTNFVPNPIVAQTVAGLSGDHGTQCAASATAAFDENRGLPGVAPNCHLIGARIGTTDAVRMADIYLWVGGFLNGSTTPGFPAMVPARAADVISSSWGSNGLGLSNTIRDCFDFLTTYGRGGRGAVLCFSLGNNGFLDYTNAAGTMFRAWPTYEKTLGIGASINTNPTNPIPVSFHADPTGTVNNIATAVDTRALYSPFGATALRKPDLVAPSHTAYNEAGALIDPILSAVRVATGAIDGCPGAAVCNDYATTFGGTSHATPAVAGAVALLLSARPGLNWVQVRDILRRTCVRIDAAQANASGQWQDLDGDGQIDYSQWYGAGRLDIDAALDLALDGTLALSDVYVRENLADVGDVPSGGSWWASPDIWVRQDATTPIPALAWSDPAPHEHARRGQDNALFCRVRNRGTAPATVVYVRAMLAHWAGPEFVYPVDFEPSTNVGAPLPTPLVPGTYLIGEARIDNLAAGADQIVKFVWPQALVPPETVVVNGVHVRWHPCLLLEASPHDGPAPLGGVAAPVQGNNNIAQRNITIVNAGDADADSFSAIIVGTRDAAGIATLVLDARALRGATGIRVHVANDRAMQQLIAAAPGAVAEITGDPKAGGKDDRHGCNVIILHRTRVRLECDGRTIDIEVAPGSKIVSSDREHADVGVGVVQHHGLACVELRGLRGQVEIPMRLAGGRFAPLLVAVTGPAEGDLRVTQRRGDGEISAGYGIRYES